MQSLSIEKLKTDVLVIGAGAGGMMAAICAADEGVDVTLCEKGNARRSGKMGEPGNTDREYNHFSDAELCPKLERQVRKRGVRIMNRVMMTVGVA